MRLSPRRRAIGARGLVLLLSFLVLASVPAQGKNRSLAFYQGDKPEDQFPAIKRAADSAQTTRVGETGITAHYRSQDVEGVEPALKQVERVLVALRELTGTTARNSVELYLHRVSSDETPPHAQPFGPGVHTGVYLFDTATSPRGWLRANRLLFEMMAHELAHVLLADLKLKDRWLEDGLPELLAFEATRELGFEPAPRHDWQPRLVALSTSALKPWDYRRSNRVFKLAKKDPDLAMLLVEEESWQYSAAEELLDRWISAGDDRSEALRGLLVRLRTDGGKIGWEETKALCLELTGQNLESLAQVTEAEKAEARLAAWRVKTARAPRVRLHALRTLAYLGLPPGVAAGELLEAVTEEIDGSRDFWRWSFYNAVGEGLSYVADPETSMDLARLAKEESKDPDFRLIPPKLWRVVAQEQRGVALAKLVELVADKGSRLRILDEANGLLEELTGESTGWEIEDKPVRRDRAARAWQGVLATAPKAGQGEAAPSTRGGT